MQHAANGLEEVVQHSLRNVSQSEAPLLAWPLVCGSAVADRTRAVSFANSILRVEVPDAGWKRELENLCGRYLVGLNRYTNAKVSRIELVVRAI